VVSGLADEIILMKSGEIVERGPARTLFRDMQHPYTKALFAASSHVPKTAARARDPSEALLAVRDVVRDYRVPAKTFLGKPGHFRAVDHVSFELHRGENLGLIGESGCGKSTLTRAILGLEPVQGGSIELSGRKVQAAGSIDRAARRKMQVVFQDPYGSFNPRHRVLRLVSEPMHLLDTKPSASDRNRQVCAMLENVGLQPSDADKYIHEFSGGQRQRIAIARALIIRPELVILDEAVSALDVSIRAQILDLLAGLSAQFGLSYLFISHDLSVVRSITDRVLIMKDGRIVEQGDTESIFRNPQHSYTRTLIDAAPVLHKVV
jgi:peptide/nickel transport system ATP-binding protein